MKVSIFTSSISDDSMKPTATDDVTVIAQNRARFLQNHGISPDDTTFVQLVYEGDDYTRFRYVDDAFRGDGIVRNPTVIADALVVTQSGHALLLPLADCIGAVVHDTRQDILMVSHLGRHNLEQFGGTKSINYLVTHYGSNPEEITVWLSPAAGRTNYPLFAFDHRSLHDVAVEQLLATGIQRTNIEVSPIDSAEDTHYFSHSQFLKGNRETDGRFAIVAVLA